MYSNFEDTITVENTSAEQVKRRIVRVFISSTFRDMQKERDELVRTVYPRLRAFCRERQADFVEVDLRWGITAEQAERDETLEICLEEIDHCRPYFIGLLGERYGWTPEKLAPGTVDKQPWLADQTGASITQIEICYGILNNPAISKHGFFYFRDPDYIRGLPVQDRKDFIAEDLQARRKLRTLKARIRASGLPIAENYANPGVLAEQVFTDLCAAIEADFPRKNIPDAMELERSGQMVYALDRARVYIHRETDFSRLDIFVAARGSFPLLLTGESGVGKSALLANWALQHSNRKAEDYIFLHFIGSTPHSTDHISMLRRLFHELKAGFSIEQEIPDSPEELQRALPNFLSMAAQSGRRIILILDGLNQLEDRGHAQRLAWLPDSFPDTVRVILSILPGQCMEAMDTRAHEELQVLPLTPAERERLTDAYLARYSKKLDESQKQLIAGTELTCNPLYLRTLLDELRRIGEFDRLEERIHYYLKAGNLPTLFGKVLERMEVDYNRDNPQLVRNTLSLIWCARQGLAESELLELLGDPPRVLWSPLYMAISELTVLHSGIINFAHDYLRQAVTSCYLDSLDSQMTVRERLINYFEEKPIDTRKLEELPWLLSRSEQWPRLYSLLSQLAFFLVLWQKDRYEAKTYWAQIEEKTPLRKVEAYRPVLEKPDTYDREILSCVASLLMDTGNVEQAGALWDHLIARSQTAGDSEGLQRALGYKGILLFSRGDLEGAAVLYRQKEELCRRLENLTDLQSALGNQGLILFKQGEFEEAMTHYREAEKICRQLDFSDGLQIALGNQGNLHYALGDTQSALEKYTKQEYICRRMGNLSGLKTSLGCQGVILYNRGELDNAMDLFKKQEQLCRSLGDVDGLQVCLGNQGNVLHARGDIIGAFQKQKEKADLCRYLGNLQGLQIALGNQGLILAQRGEPELALEQFTEQESICRRLKAANDLTLSLFNQAEILWKSNRSVQSRGKAQEALAIALQHGNSSLAGRIQALLSSF